MTNNKLIVIHQSLHGYRDGHSLLASSIELNSLEKRELQLLSDYSGTGVETGFTEYLTGYPLPKSKYFAFSKTWYAHEMPRPGCVWTHTLLIDVSFLWMLRDTKNLTNLFRRPNGGTVDEYTIPIEYDIFDETKLIVFDQNLFFWLSDKLYSATKPVIILARNTGDLQNAILDIWSFQWPKLKRNFTFCTGSVSLRSSGNELLSLQVLPYSRERSLTKSERDSVQIIDLNQDVSVGNWIDIYKSARPEHVLEFMTKFGADVNGDKSRFLPLFNLYAASNNKRQETPVVLLSFAAKVFPEPLEAKHLKSVLINTAWTTKGTKPFVIKLLLENNAFSSVSWDAAKFIQEAWELNELPNKDFREIIEIVKVNYETNVTIDLLSVISIGNWIEYVSIYESIATKIIIKNPQLFSDKTIWKSDEFIQNIWLDAAIKSKKIPLQTIISILLDNNNDEHIENIYLLFGNSIFSHIYYWIDVNNKSIGQRWQYIIKSNFVDAFVSLSKFPFYNKYHLNLISILSPTNKQWLKVPTDSIGNFILHLNLSNEDKLKSSIYTFFNTVSLTLNSESPIELAELVFQPLHNLLGRDVYDQFSWQRFQIEMGGSIYDLVELDFFSKIFKDRNDVPDWDRCEFLRRTLISSIIINKWEMSCLLTIVKERETFESIVDFCNQVKPLRKMLKSLFKNLEHSLNKNTFHFKVLKKIFD